MYPRGSGEGRKCNFRGLAYRRDRVPASVRLAFSSMRALCRRAAESSRLSHLRFPRRPPASRPALGSLGSRTPAARIHENAKVALLPLAAAAGIHETRKIAHSPARALSASAGAMQFDCIRGASHLVFPGELDPRGRRSRAARTRSRVQNLRLVRRSGARPGQGATFSLWAPLVDLGICHLSLRTSRIAGRARPPAEDQPQILHAKSRTNRIFCTEFGDSFVQVPTGEPWPASRVPRVGPHRWDALNWNQVHATSTNRRSRFVEVACTAARDERIMKRRPEGNILPSGLDCRGFRGPDLRERPPRAFALRANGRAMARPYGRPVGMSHLGRCRRSPPSGRIARCRRSSDERGSFDSLRSLRMTKGQCPPCVFALRAKGRTAVRPYHSTCESTLLARSRCARRVGKGPPYVSPAGPARAGTGPRLCPFLEGHPLPKVPQ